MTPLLGALRFLTIFRWPEGSSPSFGAGAFPLAGLVIGLFAIVADLIGGFLLPIARDVLTVAFLAIVTGGLHYDGIADTFDSFGGRSVEDRLRILRDDSIGSFGALALVLAVALKLGALGALGGSARLAALLLAPILGRWAMVATAFGAQKARADGLGAGFVDSVDRRAFFLASASAVAGAVALAGVRGLFALVLIAGLIAGVRLVAERRLDGVTGDVLGASGELCETFALLVLAQA